MTNLTAREFRVSEDGVPQAVTVFHRDDVSVAISLVIDKRSEAKARTTELTNASAGLIQRLRPRDTATVTDFVATPSVLSSLFGLKETPRGSATEPIRRHAIVFVTDAEATLDPSVVGLARRSGAVVYVIALMGDRPLAESREPALSLRRLASLSGGRAFFPADGRRLVALYNQIYEELSHQYTIGYVSTNTRRDGRWRNVIVAVERLDSSARTKQGYFAPEP